MGDCDTIPCVSDPGQKAFQQEGTLCENSRAVTNNLRCAKGGRWLHVTHIAGGWSFCQEVERYKYEETEGPLGHAKGLDVIW